MNLTGEGYKESANAICKRFLVLPHEPKVDHLSAQITHALARVDADIVGQSAFGIVLFDILGGDVLLALRALYIDTLGLVLGLHVIQHSSGGPDVSVAANGAPEIPPVVFPDPVAVLHGVVAEYQVADGAPPPCLAIDVKCQLGEEGGQNTYDVQSGLNT